jgi:hypothetical protein
MAQHNFYWSNTKLAGWIRGVAKPYALTSEGWDEWNETAQKAHPVRYWIAEEALDWLQDFVTWPIRKIYDAKYYINNRWVTRTHALTAHPSNIAPGSWCDVGNRFLPCLFNELVDFVEIELAWHHIAWGDKEETAKYKPPFWATGWFRWRTWRCAEAGLDSLEWQRRLTMGSDGWRKVKDDEADDPTPQAVKAQEILDLYNWWTQVYPNRPDLYEITGWRAACDEEREANGGKLSLGSLGKRDPALRKRMDQAHKLINRMEKDFEKEDEAMMIRLIKVRHGLWT